MPLTVDTAPSKKPIDLDELKGHLNLQGTSAHDSELNIIIAAVAKAADGLLGQQLIKATRVWTIRKFKQLTELPRPPLLTVGKVEYRDSDGNWQTVDTSEYEVNTDAKPGFVRFNNDYDVPETYENEEYPWRFTYDCGYEGDDGQGGTQSTHEEVPDDIKLLLMNVAGSYFMQREADVISYESVDVKELKTMIGRLMKGNNYNRRFG